MRLPKGAKITQLPITLREEGIHCNMSVCEVRQHEAAIWIRTDDPSTLVLVGAETGLDEYQADDLKDSGAL